MEETTTVRVHFIDGGIRIVPAKDIQFVGEEGARRATALVDGREVPVYNHPEDGYLWYEQMTYEQWKQKGNKSDDISWEEAWAGVHMALAVMSFEIGQEVEWLTRPIPNGYLRGTVMQIGSSKIKIKVQSPKTGEYKQKWVEPRYLRAK